MVTFLNVSTKCYFTHTASLTGKQNTVQMNQKRLEDTIFLRKESRVNQNYLYLYVAQKHSSVYGVSCIYSSEIINQCIKANEDQTQFAVAGGEG